jgi:hypothetical protein
MWTYQRDVREKRKEDVGGGMGGRRVVKEVSIISSYIGK